MTRKTYTGPLIDVSFDIEVCRHAAECVRGMPTVFNPTKRPWINPTGVDTEVTAQTLRDVIARCPTGALHVVEHDDDYAPIVGSRPDRFDDEEA